MYACMYAYAERQPESPFRVMKFGRNVTVDDGGNYVMFYELNVCVKIENN